VAYKEWSRAIPFTCVLPVDGLGTTPRRGIDLAQALKTDVLNDMDCLQGEERGCNAHGSDRSMTIPAVYSVSETAPLRADPLESRIVQRCRVDY